MCFQFPPREGGRRGRITYVDARDRKILVELQQDGRLTVTELGGRVGLSLSPCHRRLRALEQSAAITGNHPHRDANALGLTFEALVFVTMRAGDRDTVDAFEQAVTAIPDVLQAQRLFGDPDTCCASSPATCPPIRSSTTTASPRSPASSASAPPSS